MKSEDFNKAMCCIDDDLVEKHLREKEKNSREEKSAKTGIVKWLALAACITAVFVIALPNIHNIIGYNSEDDIYKRTHTSVATYNSLIEIIENDTLLDNFDFSAEEDCTFIITHEPDEVRDYKSVSVVRETEKDSFGVGIYFPPYDDKTTNFCVSGNILTVNGVDVEIDKVNTDSYLYSFIAEFDYGGNKYVVRSSGNSGEEVFWKGLYKLLGA